MSGALFVLLLGVQMSLPVDDASQVLRATSKAYVKAIKLDKNLRKYIKENVNHNLYKSVGNAALVASAIKEQKISYTWEF